MRNVVLLALLFAGTCLYAQDSTKVKMKTWLGVLSLSEKFRDQKNWTAADQSIVGDHFKRLVKLKDDGIVVLAGRMELAMNDADMKGLVIFYATDEKAANELMNNDPAVKSSIMLAKVYPYSIAVSACNAK